MIVTPVHEAKTKLTELLRAVEARGGVIIARHGKPVAELAPPAAGQKNRFSLEAIAERQRARGLPDVQIPTPEGIDDPVPESTWPPDDDILVRK